MRRVIFAVVLFAIELPLFAQSIEKGERHLFYHRYASAKNTFNAIIGTDPTNARAWYDLVRSYLLADESVKAVDSFKLAPATIHSDPYFEVTNGMLLLLQGKSSSAADFFDAALKKTKEKNENILGAIAEAHIRLEAGDAQYAVDLLNKAIKRDKKNPAWDVLMGQAYLKMHNGSEAYRSFRNALEKNSNFAPAYYEIGLIFLSQKNTGVYLENFKKAVAADSLYAPALYKLYVYEFNHNPLKAFSYYKKYEANADATIQNQYDYADLFYINKEYDKAIVQALHLIATQKDEAQPRLYKLLGYSFAEKEDTAQAIPYMQQYFLRQPDSSIVPRDYEIMGSFYQAQPGGDSLATVYFKKAVEIEQDSVQLLGIYQKLAQTAAKHNEFGEQEKWLRKYYTSNDNNTNLDLFNWGIARFRAEDYAGADSVFQMYIAKYPEQSFGYFWLAKSNALRDREMKDGLAVPAYQRLIEVLEKNPDDPNYKTWLVVAYSYLAAYKSNIEEDFESGIEYFRKVLTVDPENASAKKYIDVLEKSLALQQPK